MEVNICQPCSVAEAKKHKEPIEQTKVGEQSSLQNSKVGGLQKELDAVNKRFQVADFTRDEINKKLKSATRDKDCMICME